MSDAPREYVSHDFSPVDRQIDEVAKREHAITSSMLAQNYRSFAITGVIAAAGLSLLISSIFLSYYLFNHQDEEIEALEQRLVEESDRVNFLEQEIREEKRKANLRIDELNKQLNTMTANAPQIGTGSNDPHRIDLVIKTEPGAAVPHQHNTGSSAPSGPAAERLEEIGKSFSGKVNVALTWNNYHDLDLIVVSPLGEKIWYKKNRSASGGYLDTDQNTARTKTRSPIENIKWNEKPPTGEYKVYVSYYSRDRRDKHEDPTEFTLEWKVNENVKNMRGTIPYSEHRRPRLVTKFNFP